MSQPQATVKFDANNKYRILAVDDDRTALFLLAAQLEDLGYDVATAPDGKQALNILKENKIDILLLDREMPKMNGMEMVVKMKEDKRLNNIPVIMQTGHGQPEQIKEGIDLGVFYYLTKPLSRDVLQSVISAAIRDIEQHTTLKSEFEKQRISYGLVDSCSFSFSKLDEAESLAALLANLFPNPERVMMGAAELLINAVEHGNLGIHYEEKTRLIDEGRWRQEIERRQKFPENKNKKVTVVFAKKKEGLYLRITDEGPGFDWRSYLQIDPARASDNHGRGIALANMVSFDKLAYNQAGNEVTAFAEFDSGLEW